jgi:hypothetical protein
MSGRAVPARYRYCSAMHLVLGTVERWLTTAEKLPRGTVGLLRVIFFALIRWNEKIEKHWTGRVMTPRP